jgi:hypothetical protein
MLLGILIPGFGLWFLWTLFLCHCVFWLCSKGENRFGNYVFLLGITTVYIIPINSDFLGLAYLKEFLPFFIAGYLVFKYKEYLMNYKPILIATATVFFPILCFFQNATQPHFPILPKYALNSNLAIVFIPMLYKYITACFGIIFIYALIKYLISFNTIDKILRWFGMYTFEICVTHVSLLKLGIGNGSLRILSTFIIATTLSLLIAILLKKIPILNVCLYGPTRVLSHSVPK